MLDVFIMCISFLEGTGKKLGHLVIQAHFPDGTHKMRSQWETQSSEMHSSRDLGAHSCQPRYMLRSLFPQDTLAI